MRRIIGLAAAFVLLCGSPQAQETWTAAVQAAPTANSPSQTDVLALVQGNKTTQLTWALVQQALGIFGTPPTVASGGCTGGSGNVVTFNNGTAAFAITLGSLPCVGTMVLTMPASTHGWVCDAHDITAPALNWVDQSVGGSTTAVTLTDYTRTSGVVKNFTQTDVIAVKCVGY